MRPPTKGDKARAATEALVLLMMRTDLTIDANTKLAMMAGRWGALSRYHGYLSTKQIDEELNVMFTQEMGGIIKTAYLERLEDRDGS